MHSELLDAAATPHRTLTRTTVQAAVQHDVMVGSLVWLMGSYFYRAQQFEEVRSVLGCIFRTRLCGRPGKQIATEPSTLQIADPRFGGQFPGLRDYRVLGRVVCSVKRATSSQTSCGIRRL